MKTILVTGGAGFIGSNFLSRLLFSGNKYRLVCVDNLDELYSYSAKLKRANIAPFAKNRNFIFYKTDIRDIGALKRIFKKERPDLIVHLAAKVNPRLAVSDPQEYNSVNIGGTQNILELAREYSVKNVVLASSSSVYGNKNKVPLSEEDRTDYPLSPYGATKKATELLAYTYHHNHGLNVTCLRFFTAYGENNRPDLVTFKWVKNILENRPIEMSGRGKRERDYTYVGDIVSGIIKAMNKPLGYEVINLGNSSPLSLQELLALIEGATKKKAIIKFRPSHGASVEKTFANISRAKKILGWEPKTSTEKGIAKLVSWYKKRAENV